MIICLLCSPPLATGHRRENLILDDIYGLVIVCVSLLGFISLVWLKDQLGNGQAPAWLENDNQQLNRVRMREAQDRVTALRQHLDKVGERARERQQAPDRVAAAKEINDLQERLHKEVKVIGRLQRPRFTTELDRLRIREMEISHDLGMSQWKYQFALKTAQNKRVKALEAWRSSTISRLMKEYREAVGNPTAVYPKFPHFDEDPPSSEALGLSLDHRAAIEMYSRRRRNLREVEEEELRQEYKELLERRRALIEEHHAHQNMVAR